MIKTAIRIHKSNYNLGMDTPFYNYLTILRTSKKYPYNYQRRIHLEVISKTKMFTLNDD